MFFEPIGNTAGSTSWTDVVAKLVTGLNTSQDQRQQQRHDEQMAVLQMAAEQEKRRLPTWVLFTVPIVGLSGVLIAIAFLKRKSRR